MQHFTSALLQLYDAHAPYRTYPCRSRPSPCLNQELKALIRARNKIWSVYRSSRRPVDHANYKSLSNRVKSSIRNAISHHYKRQFENLPNVTKMWKLVGEMGSTSTQSEHSKIFSNLDALNRFFIGDSIPSLQPVQRSTVQISPDNLSFSSTLKLRT